MKSTLLKQKLTGLILAVIGIVSIPVCDMDATFAVLAVPAGVALILSKELMIDK